jgi:hypothetical protein
VPGTARTACSTSRASASIPARSAPKTLIPTGVRIPVVSMSIRPLIGIVQALVVPGMRSASSISATSSS